MFCEASFGPTLHISTSLYPQFRGRDLLIRELLGIEVE
jgi:hypothetical protein